MDERLEANFVKETGPRLPPDKGDTYIDDKGRVWKYKGTDVTHGPMSTTIDHVFIPDTPQTPVASRGPTDNRTDERVKADALATIGGALLMAARVLEKWAEREYPDDKKKEGP